MEMEAIFKYEIPLTRYLHFNNEEEFMAVVEKKQLDILLVIIFRELNDSEETYF
jgi:hypothetical protein|tara:strand:+ start:9056 stop:9217 length:162 start_codon:yes stop_codon:yes gene_type:complete